MSAIEFVVRDVAGAVSRGFTGEGANPSILAPVGSEISLKLDRSQVVAYNRVGDTLEITLVDGQVVVIDNFYGLDGVPASDLFLSTNGQLAQVNLAQGTEGVYYSNYVEEDSLGKWTGEDDLYFVGDPPILLAGIPNEATSRLAADFIGGLPLIPALLAGAAAAALPILGGDGGTVLDDVATRDPSDPLVGAILPTPLVNAEDRSDGVDISGTSNAPGGVVDVVIGDATQKTVVDGDGNWTVTFPPEDIPEGTYEDEIEVTITDQGDTTTVTGDLTVDTENFVTFDAELVGGDGTVNGAEAAEGVILSGRTEAGSAVVVTINGVDYEATVDGGNWQLFLPAEDIPTGEYAQDVDVKSTDPAGNVATTEGQYAVDTETFVTIETASIESDGIINFVERSDGVTVTGTAEAGATVVVTFGGTDAEATATADADGNWSVDFAAADVPQGELSETISAVATDAAGNTADVAGPITIDTRVSNFRITDPVATDNIVDQGEQAQAITVVGTVERGSTVIVELAGVKQTATVDADGNWTATYPAGSIPEGEYETKVIATATDGPGNVRTITSDVLIDTSIAVTLATPIEGNDVINAAEAVDGVVLTGTSDPGATVLVTFAGSSRTTTADVDGNWSVSYGAGDIPAGESMERVNVRATDEVGNVARVGANVLVDTIVDPLTLNDLSEGDLINRAEASDGITFTGTVEENSTVMVTFEGTTRAATVGADGTWTVDFTAAEVPAGEYTANVRVDATDAHGNTASTSDTYLVDTTPPEAPLIESYTRSGTGVRGFSTSITTDTIDLHSVAEDGTTSSVGATVTENTVFNELDFDFTSTVPNGSHLIINASDAAENQTATLFVLEQVGTNTLDIGNPGLNAFDIEAIDMQFAEDTELTLTVSDLEALCAHSDVLTIHGGLDDTVTILGASATGATSDIGGRTYDHYALGDTGTLIIDEAITVVT